MTYKNFRCRWASRVRSFICFCAPLAILLLLVSCSAGRKVRSAFGGTLPIEVTVVPEANDDSPIAVDLLLVYDAKLVDELLKMPAAEWFAKKEQYVADHPAIVVQSWEWVPGQSVEPFKVAYRSGARSVVLFADYQSEGEHRAVVGAPKPFRLVLGERDLTVEVPQ
jgi:type VI secretion system protein